MPTPTRVPHIELFEPEPGHFTVICGGKFADRLCRDEALGVIAAALFCGAIRPPYLHTYAEWDRWDRHYGSQTRQPITALLAWSGRQH